MIRCPKCHKQIETRFDRFMKKDAGWVLFTLLGMIIGGILAMDWVWYIQMPLVLFAALVSSFMWEIYMKAVRQ